MVLWSWGEFWNPGVRMLPLKLEGKSFLSSSIFWWIQITHSLWLLNSFLCLCLCMVFSSSVSFPSFRRTLVMGLRDHLIISCKYYLEILNYICKDAFFKQGQYGWNFYLGGILRNFYLGGKRILYPDIHLENSKKKTLLLPSQSVALIIVTRGHSVWLNQPW